MNCKPGDIAIIVGASQHAGRVVEVLYAAPPYSFKLPDGHPHVAQPANTWVVKCSERIVAPLAFRGGIRPTHYACCDDARLRPILPAQAHSTKSAAIAA